MKPWAKNYLRCIQCGGTNYRHMAKGFCHSCYLKNYAAAHVAEVKAYKHKWYVKSGGKEWARLHREKVHFNNLRIPVLERDNYTCRMCGSKEQLCVHHKDRNGRRSKNPNNVMSNLETLCRSCHIEVHRSELYAARKCKKKLS